MDVSYWIFILVVYLISQWVKGKSKKISNNQDSKEGNNEIISDDVGSSRYNLPQWIKNLDPQGNNYDDLNFSEDANFEENQSFNLEENKILIDQADKIENNDKKVKTSDDNIEIEKKVNLNKSSEILLKNKNKLKKNNSLTIFDLLYDKKSNLRTVFLLNEILGRPRSILKYNFKK